MLATPPPPRLIEANALPGIVADPATGQVAYLTSSTRLVVRHALGKSQTFTVAAGCSPAVVAVGAIGLNCGGVGGVLPTNGGKIAAFPGDIVALGKRWVEVRSDDRDALIDRKTAAIINLAKDPFGVHDVLDLDLVTPVDKLCKGARRGAGDSLTRYAPSRLIGERFVEPGVVYDCRTGKTRHVPKAAQVSATAIAYQRGAKVKLTGAGSYAAKTFALSGTALWLQKASGAVSVVAF